MALSDLWTSSDSQNSSGLGGTPWWQTGTSSGGGNQSVPGAFYNDITRSVMTGLPQALPNQTRTGTMDQAQQFDAGGIDRSVGQYNPNDISRLWGGVANTTDPYQGAGLDTSLQAQILAGDRGGMNHGLSAFVGGINPNTLFNGNYNAEGKQDAADAAEQAGQWQSIANFAQGLGIDPRSYGSREDMYNDLQNRTNNYYTVGGLTNATAGKAGGNLAQRSLYQFNPNTGTLDAASAPVSYVDKADHGFIGREGITGLSMMLPAFGGWAGMLGNGTAGTLSAGSGLGLTTGVSGAIGTGATNALVNAGIGALANGSGGTGFLSSLATQGLGAGVNSATGGSGLGNLFNTSTSGQQLNVSPFTSYMQNLGRAGLGNSVLGQGVQGLGALNSLSNLWRNV